MNKEQWKEIIYKNGKIDEEQVMKELEDYDFILREVPKVYCEITGGLLSQINYSAKFVLAEFNELFWDKKIITEDIKEIIKNAITLDDLKKELEDYLELTTEEDDIKVVNYHFNPRKK